MNQRKHQNYKEQKRGGWGKIQKVIIIRHHTVTLYNKKKNVRL